MLTSGYDIYNFNEDGERNGFMFKRLMTTMPTMEMLRLIFSKNGRILMKMIFNLVHPLLLIKIKIT